MTTFIALLLPLAVLAIGVGLLVGGRAGHVLTIAGTCLAGVDTLYVLINH